jgi:CDGSH-type Zn-finger protein
LNTAQPGDDHDHAVIGRSPKSPSLRPRSMKMADSQTKITPYRNGPYLIRGPFVMVDQDGNEIKVERRVVALCRCGRSQIRPFCDGTHKAIGFRADSGLAVSPEDPRVELAQSTQRSRRVSEPAAPVEDSAA